jgi:hypothetical protein
VEKQLKLDPKGNGVWMVQVDYGPINASAKDGQGGDSQGKGDPLPLDVRISGQTVSQHVLLSLQTVSKTLSNADGGPNGAPDFKNAIGVSCQPGQTGTIEGCDIPVPSMTWTETWTFVATVVTWDYPNTLTSILGRVNKDIFRSYPAETVMFMGFESDAVGTTQRKVSYTFKRSPTVTIKIPGFNDIIKKGFQYAWADYARDTSNNRSIMRPRAVYVEDVGRDGGTLVGGLPTNTWDFSQLLIGG